MRIRAKIFAKLAVIVMPLAVVGSLPLSAAPAAPSVKAEIPQSVFIYPSKPQEGRDPFFPNSTRPYVDNPDKVNTGPALTDLIFKGIVGGGNLVFAIINNHTFAAGDVGDVLTADGRRLTIHCVNINPKANTVTIEANGASVVLNLSQSP
jgi:hypothetical protein